MLKRAFHALWKKWSNSFNTYTSKCDYVTEFTHSRDKWKKTVTLLLVCDLVWHVQTILKNLDEEYKRVSGRQEDKNRRIVSFTQQTANLLCDCISVVYLVTMVTKWKGLQTNFLT